MAGLFNKLFGNFFGGGNKKIVAQAQNDESQNTKPRMSPEELLLSRASRRFNEYLTAFVRLGKTVGLPVARLSSEEWDAVNKLLAKQGVVLVPRDGAMWFERVGEAVAPMSLEQLKMRASQHFEQHLNNFLSGVNKVRFPYGRLSQSRWDELNHLIIDKGVQLVPTVDEGIWYMKFVRTNSQNRASKGAEFSDGMAAVKEKAFKQIKQQYPSLPDETAKYIVDNNDRLNTNDIYQVIRPYCSSMAQAVAAKIKEMMQFVR